MDADLDTEAQMSAITAEIASSQKLVGDVENINAVIEEYSKEDTDENMKKHAKEICSTYESIRRVRGDGNCFYRAYLFAVCEQVKQDKEMAAKFATDIASWCPKLIAGGFPDYTTTDFCEQFEEFTTGLFDADVVEAFNSQMSDYYIVFARLITSLYLQTHTDDYSAFLTEHSTMVEYCNAMVDPMYKECEHLSITALVNAIGIPLRIEYLDRSADSHAHVIEPSEKKYESMNEIKLLYRPGHYDIIYQK